MQDTKRRRLWGPDLLSYLEPAVPVRPSAEPTVAQLRVEKYADPWFFPDDVYRQQDTRRLHGAIGYFCVGRDTKAAYRLCDIIVTRFKVLIGVDLHLPGSCRAFDIIESLHTEKGAIFTKFLGFAVMKHISPLYCLETGVGHWPRMWVLLKECMHRRLMVFLAMHARVGRNGSIYRATQHVLYERQVWTIVFKMM